jgi:hypothetical protein
MAAVQNKVGTTNCPQHMPLGLLYGTGFAWFVYIRTTTIPGYLRISRGFTPHPVESRLPPIIARIHAAISIRFQATSDNREDSRHAKIIPTQVHLALLWRTALTPGPAMGTKTRLP